MSLRAGVSLADSTTVRLAVKEPPTGLDPALVRRTVTALCEMAEAAGQPIRRSVARAHIEGRMTQGHDPEAIWGARNAFGIKDETGETAARNVDWVRGGSRG